jgi:hypothetical protein
LDLHEGTKASVVAGHGGRIHYLLADEGGQVISGGMIRPVRTTEYQRLLPQAAELDFKLYRTLKDGHERILELENIVNSFTEDFANATEGEAWSSFCEWASDSLVVISKALIEQYVELGGDKADIRVPPGLLRRSVQKNAA